MRRRQDLGRQRLAALLNWWEFLRTSLWFVPSLMMAGAVALIPITFRLEQAIVSDAAIPWFIFTGDRAEARNVLATILGSMMTMASLVFSITMVVLTLAASQFGPRLIRSFMANPQTQVVLGTFVMTIVYCLLSLPTLERSFATEAALRHPPVVPRASRNAFPTRSAVSSGIIEPTCWNTSTTCAISGSETLPLASTWTEPTDMDGSW